jgi:mandelate racemase
MRYLIPALDDLGEMFIGRRIAPIEFYETGRKPLLTSFGYQGISMIAVAGRDMAAQDALARAAGVPVCALLGQHRACAGLQQQWPLVEIPDGLASEAVG